VGQSLKMDGKALSVLHVDDDPATARVVADILAAFGHRSVAAANGAEALEHLGRQGFDLILLDIHMPDISGIEVFQRLRAMPAPARDTPVIAVTADVMSRQPGEYLALGFADFVSKPILVATLRESIVRATGPRTTKARRAG
jgi:CheY-like chemotaxis protein